MADTVTKAELIIETENGTDTVQVSFNPMEYNLSKGVQYSEKSVPGLDGPIGQFIAGNSTTLNVTFLFDTYQPPTPDNPEEGGTDVTDSTKEIRKLTQIDGKLHRIPRVTFSWGSLQFTGVVTDVKESYTMFLSSGMPVRAKVDVTFKSISSGDSDKRSSPRESPDRTKVRTVVQGDALWSIAAREYRDPEKWKVIARENGILNPLELYPGQVLRLPPL